MMLDQFPPLVWQSGLVVLVIAATLGEVPRMRRLKQATSAAARLSAFRYTTACLWGAALLAPLAAGPHPLLEVKMTGDGFGWLLGSPAARGIATALAALYFALGLWPGLHCALQGAARAKYSAGLVSLHYLLPVSARERRWWVAVSISAGVCEEVLFRGFLPQFLTGQLHGSWTLAPTAAWLLGALGFGLCHAYQGAAGVVRTALAGLMFSLVAILSGNLLLPMVLHVLVDLAVLPLYRPLPDNPAHG